MGDAEGIQRRVIAGISLGLQGISNDMKTISLAVSESDYEEYRKAARQQGRSTADLIREAMAVYRATHIGKRTRLERLPALAGHRLVGELPASDEVWDEMFERGDE
jgi:hypothetical protein